MPVDRIAELRAAVAHLRDAHVDDRRHMMIDFISLGEVGALLDCADACTLAAKINPYGSVENARARDAAQAALAHLNGDDHD